MNRQPLILALAFGLAVKAAGQHFTGPLSIAGMYFSPFGDHPYLNLTPGRRLVLAGVEDGQEIVMTITALDQTKEILLTAEGATRRIFARQVEEREVINGTLAQVARLSYARNLETGDVFLFGEEVDFYMEGQLVDSTIVWEAGVAGAQPGIMMPRTFLVGARYLHSDAPAARDGAENVGLGLAMTTPGGTLTNCVRVLETDTLKPELGAAAKTYAPGIGLINDDDTLLFRECWLGTSGLPREGSFVPASSNPHFPLTPGLRLVLEGTDQASTFTLTVTVKDEVRIVAVDVAGETISIPARMVEERSERDGQLVEISRDFYAQCLETGDLWHLGRESDQHENGVIIGHAGSWLAGSGGANAGIIMPASFTPGCRYLLHSAPGLTNNLAVNSATGITVSVPAGSFSNCLRTLISNPANAGQPPLEVTYAPGVGPVQRGPLQLVAIAPAPGSGNPPTIAIRDGSLLSWPLTDELFHLQTSPDLETWVPLAERPQVENGLNQLAVPRHSEQRYFRLFAP